MTITQLAGHRRAGIFQIGEITFETAIPTRRRHVLAINKEILTLRSMAARRHSANQLRLLCNIINAEISEYDSLISLMRDRCDHPEAIAKMEQDRADLDTLRAVYEQEVPHV